jgi:hypothetical protein
MNLAYSNYSCYLIIYLFILACNQCISFTEYNRFNVVNLSSAIPLTYLPNLFIELVI